MATLTQESQPAAPTLTAPLVGALIVALAVAFLAGRASVAAKPAAPPRDAGASHAPVSGPQEAPPWTTHGFRDDETVRDACVTPDCTG
jgi:hypothetical protein